MNDRLKLISPRSATAAVEVQEKMDEIERGVVAAAQAAKEPQPPQLVISSSVRVDGTDCYFSLYAPSLPNLTCEAREEMLRAEKAFFDAVAKLLPEASRVDLTLCRGAP